MSKKKIRIALEQRRLIQRFRSTAQCPPIALGDKAANAIAREVESCISAAENRNAKISGLNEEKTTSAKDREP